MAENSFHCAECRSDLGDALERAVLVECGHLFCEICYEKGRNECGSFVCCLDWTMNRGKSQRISEFKQRAERWKSAKRRGDALETQHYHKSLSSCLNFTLYPCTYPANHPGFSDCPYDHSLRNSIPRSAPNLQPYCRHCKVYTRLTLCPRCSSPSTLRARPTRVIRCS